MHSVRRAVLRSSLSPFLATVTKRQNASLPTQFRNSVNAIKACTIPSVRYFSQTFRVAESAENNADRTAVDSALKSSRDVGSTSNQSTAGLEEGETPYGLFVRNLVFELNEDNLKESFEKFGEVTRTVIARDARGLSRGYGFVWFTNAEDMNQAAAEVNGSFWHGRRVAVAPRTKRQARTPTRTSSEPTKSVFVGNIPYETTDAELNHIFRDLENVTDVRVAVDRTTGWPRGFAHADFADVDSAIKGLEQLRGTQIGGRELRIDFASDSPRTRGPKQSQTPPEFSPADY